MHVYRARVKHAFVSETFICYACCMVRETLQKSMSFDAAVGVAINQYLLVNALTRAEVGNILGVAGSNISQRLRGRITWPAKDLFKLAELFGVTINDFMPSEASTPDGTTWIPAPYVPGQQKAPAPAGAGAPSLVAGTGFEPATSGL